MRLLNKFKQCALSSFVGILLIFCLCFSASTVGRSDLTCIAPILSADGLGRLSIGMIDTLKDDCSINVIPTMIPDFTDVSPAIKSIVQSSDKSPGLVSIFFGMLWDRQGTASDKMPDGSVVKLAYSMLESTAIPQEWVSILNNRFDAVLVPDKWLVEVYRNCGVSIPIFEFPHGVYLEKFLEQPVKKHAHSPFVFGMSAGFWPRKNHHLVIQAFLQEFGPDEPVRLRIHGRNPFGGLDELKQLEVQLSTFKQQYAATLQEYDHVVKLIESKIALLRDKYANLYKTDKYRFEYLNLIMSLKQTIASCRSAQVECIDQTFDNQRYLEFMQSLDVLVSLSQAEGYGVPPREALALGMPVILSNNTAHTTICDAGVVCPVPAALENPAYYEIFGGYYGNQFDCAIEDVRVAMRQIYEQYDAYLKKARRGRQWVQQYLYSNLKAKYRALVKPKRVILSDSNRVENDCIVTSSPALYHKYRTVMLSHRNSSCDHSQDCQSAA